MRPRAKTGLVRLDEMETVVWTVCDVHTMYDIMTMATKLPRGAVVEIALDVWHS